MSNFNSNGDSGYHHHHHHDHQHHQHHQHHEDPENIWSLTNRIHHDGMGKARDPEYSVNIVQFLQ